MAKTVEHHEFRLGQATGERLADRQRDQTILPSPEHECRLVDALDGKRRLLPEYREPLHQGLTCAFHAQQPPVAVHGLGRHARRVRIHGGDTACDQGAWRDPGDEGPQPGDHGQPETDGRVFRSKSQPCGIHENEPLNLLWMRERIGHRHFAAHGIAPDDEAIEPEMIHHRRDRRHHPGAVIAVLGGASRQPMSRQIHGDDPIAIRQIPHPAFPGMQGTRRPMKQQHGQRRIARALVAIMDPGAAHQVEKV